MCNTTVFTTVFADGREVKNNQLTLCEASRYDRPCPAHTYGRAPIEYRNFPPTPTYSPQPSPSMPYYPRSGDESDRSHRSGASSSRRSHRSSAIYINGQRLSSSPRQGGERVFVTESPPTARTPPQGFQMSYTAPSSPQNNYNNLYSTSPRQSNTTRRPYIVQDIPRINVQPVDTPPSSARHARTASNSSNNSRYSQSRPVPTADIDAAAQERLRRERHEARQRKEEQIRAQKLSDRINGANAEIDSRPPRPKPEPILKRSSTITPKASSSKTPRSGDEMLAESMGGLGLSDIEREEKRARLRALRLEREEEEAQDGRLMDRMSLPSRRATIGAGSRRSRVAYANGMYRYE